MGNGNNTESRLDGLRKKVNDLERIKKKDDENVINALRNINRYLITEYYIRIGEVLIEPMLVESYYFRKDVFEDENCHQNEEQKNHFGEFYFHKKGRGGVDICLSQSEDYYLSFLIKNARIIYDENSGNGKEQFLTQTAVCRFIKNQLETVPGAGYSFEKKSVNYNTTTMHTQRKGLQRDTYICAPLACAPINQFKNYKFTMYKSPENLVKEFLLNDFSLKDAPREEWENACERFIGYRLNKFLDECFGKQK